MNKESRCACDRRNDKIVLHIKNRSKVVCFIGTELQKNEKCVCECSVLKHTRTLTDIFNKFLKYNL